MKNGRNGKKRKTTEQLLGVLKEWRRYWKL
jgi:hypothetical protein